MSVLVAVAVLAIARPEAAGVVQQAQPSLYQAVISQPTGQNGLEEYLQAIDLLNDQTSSVYTDGAAPVSEYDSDDVKAMKSKLADQLKPLDYLAVRRAFVQKYEEAYDLIVQGNQKPCVTPPAETSAPKGFLAAIQVAGLVQARAYCLSADGKASESLDSLLNGLTFTLRAGSINMMSYLCDVVAEQKLFDQLLEELPKISLTDAIRLHRYVAEAVKQPPLVADLIRRSQKVHEMGFGKGSAYDAVMGSSGRNFADYRARLGTASPADIAQFNQAVIDGSKNAYRTQEAVADLPESQWYDASASWPAQFGYTKSKPGNSIADLANGFSRELVPSFRGMLITELRRRAQLRLLGLHARIAEYRWHNHKLPSSLSEIGDAQAIFDPLSGEAFSYSPSPDGSYRLFSKGRRETGPVELHYESKGSQAEDLRP